MGLLGFRFEGLNLGRQFFDALDESVVKVNDSRGFAQVELVELDAESSDGRVLKVGLLRLDGIDFLLEVGDTGVDVIDIDVGHVCVGCLSLVTR